MSRALIAAAGLLAFGGFLLSRRAEAAQIPLELDSAGQGIAEVLDTITMGSFRLSRMAQVNPAALQIDNVRAFLQVIRTGEGTAGPNGYRTLYGGGLFTDYSDHPRQAITRPLGGRNITSTAAGAYQALASTWDETARIMGLTDFSPAMQDLFALGRLAARGALDDVIAGRFPAAIAKAAWEWASLPGSPYGQPTYPLARLAQVYQSNGGIYA